MRVVRYILGVLFSFCSIVSLAQQNEIMNRPIDEIIKPYGESHLFSGAVLVAKNGEIIYKKAYGNQFIETDQINTTNTRFVTGPLTQSFTSVLIFKLIENNKLKLEANLGDFFPDFPQDLASISIAHLLNHTSGIQNYYQMDGWAEGKYDQKISDDEFIEAITKMPLLFEPGTNYFYSNAGYFLLGKIIEKVSGQTYEEVLKELLVDPLGMTNTGVCEGFERTHNVAKAYYLSSGGLKQQDRLNMSLFKATGSICSTVDDLFKLDQALYTNQLLTDASKAVLFNPENNFGWKTEDLSIPGHDGELLIVENNGETECYSSLLVRFVNDNHTIILLGNTGTGLLIKEKLVNAITQVLYEIPSLDSKKDVMPLIAKSLLRGDLEATIRRIVSVNYLFDADEKLINEFGNQLFWFGNEADAIKIFELNTKLFPKSSGALFQLAEKYKETNQLAKAIPVYEKVLEFYPNNSYIQNIIKQNSQ